MKKFFTLLFIFLFTFCFSLEVSAITLKGRVTYQSKEVKNALANVDKVRKEAFENSQQSFDVSSHKKHFNDPFYRENKRFAKKKVSYTIGDLSLTFLMTVIVLAMMTHLISLIITTEKVSLNLLDIILI